MNRTSGGAQAETRLVRRAIPAGAAKVFRRFQRTDASGSTDAVQRSRSGSGPGATRADGRNGDRRAAEESQRRTGSETGEPAGRNDPLHAGRNGRRLPGLRRAAACDEHGSAAGTEDHSGAGKRRRACAPRVQLPQLRADGRSDAGRYRTHAGPGVAGQSGVAFHAGARDPSKIREQLAALPAGRTVPAMGHRPVAADDGQLADRRQ